jgi:hypothetical protein
MSNTECPPLPAASINLNDLAASLAKGEPADVAIAKATEVSAPVAPEAEPAPKTPAKAADKAADSE